MDQGTYWLSVQDSGVVTYGSPCRDNTNEHINDCYDEMLNDRETFEPLHLVQAVSHPCAFYNPQQKSFLMKNDQLVIINKALAQTYLTQNNLDGYVPIECKVHLS